MITGEGHVDHRIGTCVVYGGGYMHVIRGGGYMSTME